MEKTMYTTTRNIFAVTAISAAVLGCTVQSPSTRAVGPAGGDAQASLRANANGQYALGKQYLGSARSELAEVAFTQAIAFNPEHADAYNGRATARLRMGQLDAALVDMNKAVDLQPQAAYLLGNLGYVQMLKGERESAAQSFQKALEMDPADSRSRTHLAMLTMSAHAAVQTPAVKPTAISSKTPEPVKAPERMLNVMNVEYPQHTATVKNADRSVAPQLSVINVPAPFAEPATVQTPVVAVAPAPFAEPAPIQTAAVKSSPADEKKAAAAVTPRVEVLNGNGVRGAARRAARDLGGKSEVQVVRVADAARFNVRQSKIIYRAGFENVAAKLSSHFSGQPLLKQQDTPLAKGKADVRVVLGKDQTKLPTTRLATKPAPADGEATATSEKAPAATVALAY